MKGRLAEKIIIDLFIFILLLIIIFAVSLKGGSVPFLRKKTAVFIENGTGSSLLEIAKANKVSPIILAAANNLDIFSEKVEETRLVVPSGIRPEERDRLIHENLSRIEEKKAVIKAIEARLLEEKTKIENLGKDIEYYRIELKYPNSRYVTEPMIKHYNDMVEKYNLLSAEYKKTGQEYMDNVDNLNRMVDKYNKIIELDNSFLARSG